MVIDKSRTFFSPFFDDRIEATSWTTFRKGITVYSLFKARTSPFFMDCDEGSFVVVGIMRKLNLGGNNTWPSAIA